MILGVVVSLSFLLVSTQPASHGLEERRNVPSPLTGQGSSGGAHRADSRLNKRQSSCTIIYLIEPPTSLVCNPPPLQSINLTCQLYVPANLVNRQVATGWYFSKDGITADLIQSSQFNGDTNAAYESRLVVRFFLPTSTLRLMLLLFLGSESYAWFIFLFHINIRSSGAI